MSHLSTSSQTSATSTLYQTNVHMALCFAVKEISNDEGVGKVFCAPSYVDILQSSIPLKA